MTQDSLRRAITLYDRFTHEGMDRRRFIAELTAIAGSTAAATTLLSAIAADPAAAALTAPDDPASITHRVQWRTGPGQPARNAPVAGKPDAGVKGRPTTAPATASERLLNGYLAAPAGSPAPLPGVIVVHENRGLNPYIEDVARRVAKAGFVALAPDGLSSVGGYPGNDDKGRELQQTVDPGKLMNDFFAAVEFLMKSELTTGKVGITGFCYGGGVANAAAVAYPELAAAVPFYGRQPRPEDVPRIKAPLLLHYAGLDNGINEGWPAYEAALKAAGKTYEAYIYPGVNHGFHNDSTPRYDEAAAKLAWDRTVGWFKRYLA